jgi:folate-binding protein YgfZ
MRLEVMNKMCLHSGIVFMAGPIMAQQGFFTKLENRGLIRISGTARRKFLQGLISNDINLLDTHPLIYTCLLTPNGKFLHDFFIREENETLLLDCEGGERTHDLAKRFEVYKLRADITIEMTNPVTVYVVIGDSSIGLPDPRHSDMGTRTHKKPENLPEEPFSSWDIHRIKLCIPDGSRDMIPEKSTLLECGIDRLNGISFDKGCYMGQELTARMHYRGLVKKRLSVVTGENLPAAGEDIIQNGQRIGEMRSSCGLYGLAVRTRTQAQNSN